MHAYHARTDRFRLLDTWTPVDLDRWIERTTWWARPDAMRTRQQMAVEIVEALAGRFVGKRMTIDVAGTTIELDLLAVRGETDAPASSDIVTWWSEMPGAREARRFTRAVTGLPLEDRHPDIVDRVYVDAGNVTIDGNAVGDITALVRDVHVSYGTTTELVTGAIDLRVRSTRGHVVDWLGRVLDDWEIALADGGRVAAKPPDRRVTALLQPEGLDGDDAVLHVVGVRLRGRDLRLPKRFIRRVVQTLPTLPQGLELRTARIGDPDIEVALHHPGLRLPIKPEHLRKAVREGVGLLKLG